MREDPNSEAVKVTAPHEPHPSQLLLKAAAIQPPAPVPQGSVSKQLITHSTPGAGGVGGLHHPFSFEAEHKFTQKPQAARTTAAQGWEDPKKRLLPSTALLPHPLCKATQ